MSAGTLDPAFSKETVSYKLDVPNEVTSVTVTGVKAAEIAEVSAAVTLDGLEPGIAQTAAITVTSGDRKNVRTYKVEVVRQAVDCDLAAIALTADPDFVSVVMEPDFDPAVTEYAVRVPYGLSSLTVAGTAHDPAASVSEATILSGMEQGKSYTATLAVTGKDGEAVKNYTINVLCQRYEPADLIEIAVSSGTLSPAFHPDIVNYFLNVDNATTSVAVRGTPVVAYAVVTPEIVLTDLEEGIARTAAIVVTLSEAKTEKSYTVTVVRAETVDCGLASLTLATDPDVAVELEPAFNPAIVDYTVCVPNAVTGLTVSGEASDPKAAVTEAVTLVDMEEDTNYTAALTVTGHDGKASKTYTLHVTRRSYGPADLRAIELSSGSLKPAFDPDITEYFLTVDTTVTMVTIQGIPAKADASATEAVTLSGLAESWPMDASIAVTGADGVTKKTYTVEVTRADGINANLDGLHLTTGYGYAPLFLEPAFSPDIIEYAVSVPNELTSFTITGNVQDDDSEVTAPVSITAMSVGTVYTAALTVTAEDGTTTKTYTVKATRQASANAKLRDIAVATAIPDQAYGSLEPEFSPSIADYSLSLYNSITDVSLTGLPADMAATVSPAISLSDLVPETPQTATFVVTAENGERKTYTVSVSRQADGRAAVSALVTPSFLSAGTPTNALSLSGVTTATTLTEEFGEEDNVPVKYKITKATQTGSGSYDRIATMKPSGNAIYPGSVLASGSIKSGEYREISSGLKRPVSLVCSTLDGPVASTTVVPKRLVVDNFLKQSLAKVRVTSEPELQIQLYELYDEASFDTAFAAGAADLDDDVKATLKAKLKSFTPGVKQRIFFGRVVETYFSIDVDQTADAFLYDQYDIDDFEGTRPVYVASVSYGRISYVLTPSIFSLDEFQTALRTVCDRTQPIDSSVVISAYNRIWGSVDSGYIVGGSDAETWPKTFAEKIREEVFTVATPGVPVSYQLRFLDDNTVANVAYAGAYSTRSVRIIPGTITVSFHVTCLNIHAPDVGATLQVYGDIRYHKGDSTAAPYQTLWSHSRDKTFNECKKDISTSISGPVMSYTFSSLLDPLTLYIEMKEKDIGKSYDDLGSNTRTTNAKFFVKNSQEFSFSCSSGKNSAISVLQPKAYITYGE